MIPAFNAAVAGLLEATNKAATAAANIVQAPARNGGFSEQVAASYAPSPTEKPKPNTPKTSVGQLGGPPLRGGAPLYVPSLAEDLVLIREALHAYKANAKVIHTLDDLTRELLDVVGSKPEDANKKPTES